MVPRRGAGFMKVKNSRAMQAVRGVFVLSVCLVGGALASGFIQASSAGSVWLGVVWGALWLLAHYRKIRWMTDVAFAALMLVVIMAALYGVSPVWLLVAVVAGLLAWDADHFVRRTAPADDILRVSALVRQHAVRVGLVLTLGSMVAGMALRVHVQLNFAIALFLALLAVIGLAGVVAALRRESAE